jgi:small subunit ribosomal protein S11
MGTAAAKVDRFDKTSKKRKVKIVVFHITSTFNNNMVTVTDIKGDTLAWSSAGMHGFKGAKRSTYYAAQVTAEHVARLVKKMGVTGAQISIRGIGGGRDAAVRAIFKTEIEIFSISYDSRVPHNGCKPRKKRRV